jgi:hypothetical protein
MHNRLYFEATMARFTYTRVSATIRFYTDYNYASRSYSLLVVDLRFRNL